MQSSFSESRVGMFTASEIYKLLKRGKNKNEYFGDVARGYINEKIAEIITGEPKVNLKSAATEWGLEKETDAVKWFEEITEKKVVHFGMNEYMFFPYNAVSGCSPDGLVQGESANIQVKCPFNSASHIKYLLHGDNAQEWLKKESEEYYAQCQFEMMCCKTRKCYFVSYDDRAINPEHRMAIIELLPDKEIIDALNERIERASEIVRLSLEELEEKQVKYSTILITPTEDGYIADKI